MDQETFNKIKEQAINHVIKKFFLDSPPSEKLAIHHFLEEFLNAFMESERTIFLEKGN